MYNKVAKPYRTHDPKMSSYHRKFKHNFDLILSKKPSYCVIACRDYPRCDDLITIFLKRD